MNTHNREAFESQDKRRQIWATWIQSICTEKVLLYSTMQKIKLKNLSMNQATILQHSKVFLAGY
jgi:hypothetical protein